MSFRTTYPYTIFSVRTHSFKLKVSTNKEIKNTENSFIGINIKYQQEVIEYCVDLQYKEAIPNRTTIKIFNPITEERFSLFVDRNYRGIESQLRELAKEISDDFLHSLMSRKYRIKRYEQLNPQNGR